MTTISPDPVRRSVTTSFGEASDLERGEGPAALFVHGVLLNAHLWDSTIACLSGERRCVAVDLMGNGATKVADHQDLSFGAQAEMLAEFIDALALGKVDLVGNDSGGAIAQILAARQPERVRSLTLTNCDTHDNIIPSAVVPFVEAVRAGKALDIFEPMLADIDRARDFLSSALENPDAVPDETLRLLVEPLIRNERDGRSTHRWMQALSADGLIAAEAALARLTIPTLVVWGTGDVFFEVAWAYWLADLIPGTFDVVEVPEGRLLLPIEHPQLLADQVRRVWRHTSTLVDIVGGRARIVRLSVGDEDVVVAAGDLFDHTPRHDWARRFLASPGHHLFVALDGDAPIGFVSGVETTHPDKGTEMFLYELGTREDHRRRGIGRALVTAITELARDRGCYGIWVGTEGDNTAAPPPTNQPGSTPRRRPSRSHGPSRPSHDDSRKL